MGKLNDILAKFMTLGLGNMWTFYICVIIGIVPVFIPSTETSLLYWSNFIQLIFLPVIIVGQDILGQSSKEQALQDHKRIKIILDKLQRGIQENNQELQILKKLVNQDSLDNT